MPDLWMDVDTALPEVPVNVLPLIDDTDFKAIEDAVAYNAAGLALRWHFVDPSGNYTVTSVTPTSGGSYDWTDQGDSGIYTIEIPASGGASINNDTEGIGWFTGKATGVLPWRGPTIGFRPAAINNALVRGTVNVGAAALEAIGLDHLIAASVAGGDVADNSIIAKLVSRSATADFDSYNNTTDSLEALRDRGDVAWITGANAAADKSYVPTFADRLTGDNEGGAWSDLGVVDGTMFVTGEVATGDFLNVSAAFTATPGDVPAALNVWGYYSGNATHYIIVKALDIVGGAMETIGTISNGSAVALYSFQLGPRHIDPATGDVVIQFVHNGGVAGNTAHALYLDKLELKANSESVGLTAEEVREEIDLNSTQLASLVSSMATILGRVVGTIAAGTHNPQGGDAFARLGAPAGASIAADIAAVKSKTDALPADPAGISNLPAAPDNAGIAAIKAKTDNLPALPAESGEASAAVGTLDIPTVEEIVTAVIEELLTDHPTAGASLGSVLYNLAYHMTYGLFNMTGPKVSQLYNRVGDPSAPSAGSIAKMIDDVPTAAENADAADSALSAAHGAGAWGFAVPPDWVEINENTLDTDGVALGLCVTGLGIPVANMIVTTYAVADVDRANPVSQANTLGDGSFSLFVPPTATYTVYFEKAGTEEVTPREVEVE